ncbi:hypothetical protein Cni_G15257 [Canna indica]|uniref:SAUR family protein n=1 Tax=Canna indica TaxID=4628 RepID=A0AAQ3QEP9_9LILI|nr:hypothetical protein Cni_G15257 [Canna indica]
MIKRWHSSSKITRTAGGGSGSSSRSQEEETARWHSASFHSDMIPAGLHPVYVGKSRRRYLVGSDLVDHPLFRVLIERTGGSTDAGTVVGCEVVLFEHLLWMLENADPQPESLDELVDYYSC